MYIHATNIIVVFLKCKFLAAKLREGILKWNVLSQFCGKRFQNEMCCRSFAGRNFKMKCVAAVLREGISKWNVLPQFCGKRFPREMCCRSFAAGKCTFYFCSLSIQGLYDRFLISGTDILYCNFSLTGRLELTESELCHPDWTKLTELELCHPDNADWIWIDRVGTLSSRRIIISCYKPFVSVLRLLLCVQIRWHRLWQERL